MRVQFISSTKKLLISKMTKYLVSALDLDYMFTLSDDMIVTPLKSAMKPQKIYATTPIMTSVRTPLEIQCMIFAKLAAMYIRDMNFQKAFEIIVLHNVLVIYFHQLIFGSDPVARISQKIQQLRFCFMLTEGLHTRALNRVQEPGDLVEYFCITLRLLDDNPLRNHSSLRPWDFDCIDFQVNSMSSPIVNSSFGEIHPNLFQCLKSGNLLGDITWLQGSAENGIYTATRLLRPVIIFRFIDKYDRFLYIREKNLFAFDAVADHLKCCFGENTAVFYTTSFIEENMHQEAIHYIEELGHR